MHNEDAESGCESATPSGTGVISEMLTRIDASFVRQTLAPVSAMEAGVAFRTTADG